MAEQLRGAPEVAESLPRLREEAVKKEVEDKDLGMAGMEDDSLQATSCAAALWRPLMALVDT